MMPLLSKHSSLSQISSFVEHLGIQLISIIKDLEKFQTPLEHILWPILHISVDLLLQAS